MITIFMGGLHFMWKETKGIATLLIHDVTSLFRNIRVSLAEWKSHTKNSNNYIRTYVLVISTYV